MSGGNCRLIIVRVRHRSVAFAPKVTVTNSVFVRDAVVIGAASAGIAEFIV